ncbi:histidine phosphatase family protein [Psychrobacter sp. ASPA161_9]|uniref:histidine phosphatase family protein n=1 Tax=Psychrobacter sp. ASPA161_9 TaxID=3160961 RepID=UPI003F7E33AB
MADFWLRIFLVRHGHVAYFDKENKPVNPKYASLSPQGVEQIRLLAESIKDISFENVYSSTMPRSIQTAEILTQYQPSKEVIAVDTIREIKSGRLRDVPADKAQTELKEAYLLQTNQLQHFLQGENWEAFSRRVIEWFEQVIVSDSSRQNILISSHDVVNRIIINWMFDNHLADIYTQEQDYGCLNILDIHVKNNRIFRKRIKLQNFTIYNPFKTELFNSAMDDVYNMYVNNNGFKE